MSSPGSPAANMKAPQGSSPTPKCARKPEVEDTDNEGHMLHEALNHVGGKSELPLHLSQNGMEWQLIPTHPP